MTTATAPNLNAFLYSPEARAKAIERLKGKMATVKTLKGEAFNEVYKGYKAKLKILEDMK